jgi:hypothetical protein
MKTLKILDLVILTSFCLYRTETIIVEDGGVGHVLHRSDESYQLRDNIARWHYLNQVLGLISVNITPVSVDFSSFQIISKVSISFNYKLFLL